MGIFCPAAPRHRSSSGFPTTADAFQTTYGGRYTDALVAKLNPIGSMLVYSTYLGGNDIEYGSGIGVLRRIVNGICYTIGLNTPA